jgi:hypothetical protein
MGRFYSILVSAPKSLGVSVSDPASFDGRAGFWSSQTYADAASIRKVDNPGSLNVEFDFAEFVQGIPGSEAGASTLTIHGVSLEDIQQASDFYGLTLTMKAGMSAGYPLANPAQAGVIMFGTILQSFGNWIGTEMTLDFVVIASQFTQEVPGNFTFDWQPGTSLQDALRLTFTSAYLSRSAISILPPTIVFQLSRTYAPQPNGHRGRYSTLRNLSAFINSLTKPTSPDGNGVYISYLNASNTILVFDGLGESPKHPVQIQFTDLIGQPTWVAPYTMQFMTVLRADIGVGTWIRMPQGLYGPGAITTTGGAFQSRGAPGPSYPLSLKYQSSFRGKFLVKSVRQIGNYRDPEGSSWSTVFQCAPQSQANS